MDIYEKQKNGFIFKDCNGVELPILGYGNDNGMTDGTGATGVDNTANLSNNPYLYNNPYRELVDDDRDNDNNDNGNITILVNPVPTSADELIIGVNKKSQEWKTKKSQEWRKNTSLKVQERQCQTTRRAQKFQAQEFQTTTACPPLTLQ